MERTVLIQGTVSASSSETFSSERMSSPYTLKKLRFHFPPNSKRKLRVRFYAGTSAPPNAQDILGERGNVNYVSGDGNTVEVVVNQRFNSGVYLYAAGENTSTTDDRTVHVEAVVEEE